jgi:hypothetical protein
MYPYPDDMEILQIGHGIVFAALNVDMSYASLCNLQPLQCIFTTSDSSTAAASSLGVLVHQTELNYRAIH